MNILLVSSNTKGDEPTRPPYKFNSILISDRVGPDSATSGCRNPFYLARPAISADATRIPLVLVTTIALLDQQDSATTHIPKSLGFADNRRQRFIP